MSLSIYKMQRWHFSSGFMKPDKCCFICNTVEKVKIIVLYFKIIVAYKRIFDAHVNAIFKKAGLELNTLASITLYID